MIDMVIHPIITIEGSHGTLTVDAATGFIMARTSCDCDDCKGTGYADILFIDPLSFDFYAKRFGATDILDVSAIYADGGYTRAMGEAFQQAHDDPDGWWRSDEVHLLADMRGED